MTYTGRAKIADMAPNHPFARPSITIGMPKPEPKASQDATLSNGKEYDYANTVRREQAGAEAATGGAPTDKKVETVTEQAATPESPPPKP
jgi:hypothetical protein